MKNILLLTQHVGETHGDVDRYWKMMIVVRRLNTKRLHRPGQHAPVEGCNAYQLPWGIITIVLPLA